MASLHRRWWAPALLSVGVALALVAPRLLGVHAVPVPSVPGPPELAYDDWGAALAATVRPDGVDYPAFVSEGEAFLRFVHGLSAVGPKSTPERFATEPERLAYYLNAYNALAVHGVLYHGVRATVHEVHGALEPTPGFGFFWAQRFTLDGETVHLYELENDVVRPFGDARIHAALNCASASCPPLGPEPFVPERLDAQLDAATRAWVADPEHVRVTDTEVRLNPIFDWYAEDFAEHAERLGVGTAVTDWIAHYLPERSARSLREAVAEGRPIRYPAYDWSINAARPAPGAEDVAEEPPPAPTDGAESS